MSAKSIQRKIDVAHKKIGKKIGYGYGLYRPLSNINVLDDANLIADNVKSTFTLSDTYMTALAWQIPVWTCYTDATQAEEGDFLYSEDQSRTFFILARLAHQPVLAVEVNDRIDLKIVGYGDNGSGFAPDTTTYFAKNLPCYLSYGAQQMSGGIPARTNASAGARTATIITTVPRTQVLMGSSVIVPDGFQGDVVSYDYSSVGVALRFTAQEFSVK